MILFILMSVSVVQAEPSEEEQCLNLNEILLPLADLVLVNTTPPPQIRLCRVLSRVSNKINKGTEKGKIKAIKKLNKFIKVTYNNSPAKRNRINQPATDLLIAEAQRLIGILEGGISLPPDPGEAGKATLQGIDSDNDGMRDDVQIFIAQQWLDSERIRSLMTQVGKGVLYELTIADDQALIRAHVETGMGFRANMCTSYIRWKYKVDAYDAYSKVLKPKILNTWERVDASLLAWQQLSGWGPDSDRGTKESRNQYCDFDPDALLN